MDVLLRRVERLTPFNVKRGLVHLITGLSISIAGLYLSHSILLSIMIPLTIAWLLIDLVRMRSTSFGILFNAWLAPFMRDYEKTRLTGASFLMVGSLLTFILFSKEIAAVAVLFLAAGDPLAHFIRYQLSKTDLFYQLVGETFACFTICVIIGGLVQHYANLSLSSVSIIISAFIATIVQALPLPIDDNLTIPVCSGVIIWLIQMLHV